MSHTEPIATWRIDRNAVDYAVERVNRINARAGKNGLDGRYTWELGKTTREPHWYGGETDRKPDYYVERVEFHLYGAAPKLGGWSFLAVLTWDAGVLVTRTVPGFDGVIDRATLTAGECDHCHKVRARRDCYLVENAEGRRVQVGSNCIKDFLGHHFTPGMLLSAGSLDDIEEGARSGWSTPTAPAVDVLAYAAAICAETGWVSREKAEIEYRTPSSQILRSCLFPYSRGDNELATTYAPAAAHYEEARQVLAWTQAVDAQGSEYLANLNAIATAPADDMDGQVWVSERNVGMLGSAVAAYHREQAKQVEQATRLVSQHVGAKGDRLEVTVTVRGDTSIDGDWGVSHLYKLTDDDGNVFKWFSSRNMQWTVGDQVTLKGTVKGHDEYNGVAETQLTRCAVAA